jgi:hypothetical protein
VHLAHARCGCTCGVCKAKCGASVLASWCPHNMRLQQHSRAAYLQGNC